MNISYLIYEAEQPRSMAAQREADVQAGEMAAAVARLGRSLRHLVAGRQDARRDDHRPATATTTCVVPRPRKPVDR
jgi:hypothetical protein